MASREQMFIWLDQAEAAYHQLAVGGGVRVFVDQNGERIEYSAANRNGLSVYIYELKRRLGLIQVVGPLTPWF